MQQILHHMRSNGMNPGETITLDGHVHRFAASPTDRGRAGWYVGFINFTQREGSEFHVVRYGNFKTGEVFQYQSEGVQYTPADRSAIKRAIEQAKAQADRDRRAAQELVSSECQETWQTFRDQVDSMPVYLARKQITELFGARVGIHATQGERLIVPCRDVNGKLWSMQSIFSTGEKRFYPGGRIEGCFHTIGNMQESDTIIICEGFATGCSLRMASEKCVVVAFQASNLESVAEVIKRKYPEKLYIIAGDDDLWTTKPNGEAWNPGRDAAEEAARRIMATPVFPKFGQLERGRTDFNDLHQAEGIDRVRDQIDIIKPVASYILSLGYDESNYYFLSSTNPQIQKIPSAGLGTLAGLCRLQPTEYWESHFPNIKGDGVNLQGAMNSLMIDCHKKGIFSPDRIRNRGVWRDKDNIVFHMGNALWINGDENIPLHKNGMKSKYIYESAEPLPEPHHRPLSLDEAQMLASVAHQIRWKKQQAWIFYLGWIAISPIAGAMSWRPHVWLTGPSGSGKSYIMQNITYKLFQETAQFFRGQTTEAGIRQKSGRSTLPIIFDEFETNDEMSGNRIRSILELARQASSESDGIVAKGTVSGEAIEYKPQWSMLVASVRLNLIHEEDENRFCVLELDRGETGVDQFQVLEQLVADLGPEYGRRLFSRSLNLANVIRESADTFMRVIAQNYPMRIAQQYGALLAGFWTFCSDQPITVPEAFDLISSLDLSMAKETADRNDEGECLDFLMDKVVRGESGGVTFELSIREMILKNSRSGSNPMSIDFVDSLERIGITVFQSHGTGINKKGVGISARHRSIAEFFKGSRWASNYAKQLSRIPGVEMGRVCRFKSTGDMKKCVSIPMSYILKELADD